MLRLSRSKLYYDTDVLGTRALPVPVLLSPTELISGIGQKRSISHVFVFPVQSVTKIYSREWVNKIVIPNENLMTGELSPDGVSIERSV